MKFFVFNILIFLFFISQSFAAPQNQQQKAIEQIGLLIDQIKQEMNNSNHSLSVDQYQKSLQHVNQSILGLEHLEKIFMPLGERVKRLVELEENIEKQVEQKIDSMPQKSKARKSYKGELFQQQTGNRDDTLATIQIIQEELKKNPLQDPQTQNSVKSQQPKKIKLFNDLVKLLLKAEKEENHVLDRMSLFDFSQAYKHIEKSLEYLREALEKIKSNQPPQQQKQCNQQSKSNNTKPQSQQQNPQKKQSGNASQKKDKKNSSQQKQADAKKMKAQKALKELIRLEKKAAEEKKQREKYYGIRPESSTPLSPEKDW